GAFREAFWGPSFPTESLFQPIENGSQRPEMRADLPVELLPERRLLARLLAPLRQDPVDQIAGDGSADVAAGRAVPDVLDEHGIGQRPGLELLAAREAHEP